MSNLSASTLSRTRPAATEDVGTWGIITIENIVATFTDIKGDCFFAVKWLKVLAIRVVDEHELALLHRNQRPIRQYQNNQNRVGQVTMKNI